VDDLSDAADEAAYRAAWVAFTSRVAIGRALGRQAGELVWNKATQFF
jgi:hypothetical protein